eukprot:g5412.t1
MASSDACDGQQGRDAQDELGGSFSELKGHATVFRYWGAPPPDIERRCIFCRIASGLSKPGVHESAELLASSPRAVAFADIAPVAEAHVLVIPRAHIKNWRGFVPGGEHASLVREMVAMGTEAVHALGHAVNDPDRPLRVGFIRPPWNSVHHVHMHVMTTPLRRDVGFLHRLGFSSGCFFATAAEVLRTLGGDGAGGGDAGSAPPATTARM